jgi:hypothetical protein
MKLFNRYVAWHCENLPVCRARMILGFVVVGLAVAGGVTVWLRGWVG